MLLRQGPSGPTNNLPSFSSLPVNRNAAAVASIDCSRGPAQALLLNQSCNVSFTNLPAGQPTWFQLVVGQLAGGGFVPTFVGAKTPGGVPLTLSTAAFDLDIVSFFWDGTTIYATVGGLAFA